MSPPRNTVWNPYDYANNFPHHRAGQIHIAGHSKFEKYDLASHGHPIFSTFVTGFRAEEIVLQPPTPPVDFILIEDRKASTFF